MTPVRSLITTESWRLLVARNAGVARVVLLEVVVVLSCRREPRIRTSIRSLQEQPTTASESFTVRGPAGAARMSSGPSI